MTFRNKQLSVPVDGLRSIETVLHPVLHRQGSHARTHVTRSGINGRHQKPVSGLGACCSSVSSLSMGVNLSRKRLSSSPAISKVLSINDTNKACVCMLGTCVVLGRGRRFGVGLNGEELVHLPLHARRRHPTRAALPKQRLRDRVPSSLVQGGGGFAPKRAPGRRAVGGKRQAAGGGGEGRRGGGAPGPGGGKEFSVAADGGAGAATSTLCSHVPTS